MRDVYSPTGRGLGFYISFARPQDVAYASICQLRPIRKQYSTDLLIGC